MISRILFVLFTLSITLACFFGMVKKNTPLEKGVPHSVKRESHLVKKAPQKVKRESHLVKKVPFSLKFVIAREVSRLKEPKMRKGIVGEALAVSTPFKKAEAHVQQGFALIHAQWDFEAYRHFCAALQEDPDCLLGYCGVALALAKPHHEYAHCRIAAVQRMLDLMEADKKREDAGKTVRFPAIEREFCAAVITLVEGDLKMATILFYKLASQYPQFLQVRLLAFYLSRGGYDAMGDPMPQQVKVVKAMKELLKKHSENPMVIAFWLALNAEVSNRGDFIQKEVLPYAKKLVKLNPQIPSWQHLLGYFAWRVGDYQLAEKSFTKAARLYENWMKREGVSLNDNAGFVKAECYLANAKYQRGDVGGALEVARKVRALKFDVKRPHSEGNAILLWQGYSLPARLYAARNAKHDLNRALKSIPKREELKALVQNRKKPLIAGVYLDALSMYLGARKAIQAGDEKGAQVLHFSSFCRNRLGMLRLKKIAQRGGDYPFYLIALKDLEIADAELSGLTAMIGSKSTRSIAVGHFLIASEKQYTPMMMMRFPLIFDPLENRLGEYYESVKNYQKALDAYREAERRVIKNRKALKGQYRCLKALGKKEEAQKIKELLRKKR